MAKYGENTLFGPSMYQVMDDKDRKIFDGLVKKIDKRVADMNRLAEE